MPFDTLILNGTIIDGTNTPRYKGDLGLSSGRITAIGALGHAEAAKRIDATGYIVSPGFIDMHSHSDVTLFDDPGGESKAHQGVTTEVTGNCGYSPFPASIGGPKALQENLGKTLIGRTPWTWNTLDEWGENLHNNGISINVAPQLGNAALQVSAGAIEDRRATKDEMHKMKNLVAETMEMGAFSLSTGLSLAPSGYASTEEVVELCKVAAGYQGAFYVTHARVGNGKHLSSIKEAIEIGQRAGIPVQFSHMAIIDRRVFGDGPAMVNLLVEARKQGLDITYDVYPYTAAGGSLQQLVPLWAQTGTVDDFVDRVHDPKTRPRICKEVAIGNGGLQPLWDAWHVAYTNTAANRPLIGKSVEDIARIRNVEPAEAVLQLIEEEGGSVPTRVHNRDEGDVRYFLSHDLAMIGSDGRAVSPDGPYSTALPHPRFYGTYPRILGRYVRDEPALLTLESAISKMTGLPAERMGMKERGTVKEGLVADLVIFDPDTVIDNATWEDPHQYPTGIPHVLVNGVAIVDNSKHTGAMPGRVLRRGTC